MNLKQSLVIALLFGAIGLASWEFYWRSQGKIPTIQDDNGLWASTRAKVDKLTDEDFLFVGSSRIHFDVQLGIWEELTGKKPVQLAMGGSSPLPMLRDIARNSSFSGTIIVGITPPLFFSTTFPKAPPISGPQERIDYFKKRTYAQKFNQWLSMPLQRNLVMIHSYEEMVSGNFDLRSILETVQIGNRTKKPQMPPFPEFGSIDEDRNVRMLDRMIKEPEFAQTIINAWMFLIKGSASMPPPDKKSTTAFFLEDIEILKKRGARIILLRAPSAGEFHEIEQKVAPRKTFWDELVSKSGLPSYHFEDYEQFKALHLPELSHLSAEDADFFTRELIKIMKTDGLLIN